MPSFRGLVLSEDYANTFGSIKGNSFATMYRCYVIKQMVNTTAYTIELWMHAGGCEALMKLESFVNYIPFSILESTFF